MAKLTKAQKIAAYRKLGLKLSMTHEEMDKAYMERAELEPKSYPIFDGQPEW